MKNSEGNTMKHGKGMKQGNTRKHGKGMKHGHP
jgi:hypothetical protein